MNKDFSDIVKAFSCVLIFLHHFYLGQPLVVPLGYIGCSIFFFLSVYGLGKSQDKKGLSFWPFLKHRLSRVYIPLLLVNLFFIVATIIISGNICVVPIYHVACDYLTLQTVDGLWQTLLYILDVWQTDSVTWFIHVLLLVYIYVWGVQKIKDRRIFSAVVLGSFVLTELVLVKLKAESWYMVDLTGVVIGLLIFKFEYVAERYCNLLAMSLLALLLVFTVSISVVGLESLRPFVIILLGFCYSGAAVLLVYLAGLKIKPSSSTVASFWGGVSYYIYLTHIKLSCIYSELVGEKNIVVFIAIVLFSVIFYQLNTKFYDRKA